MSGDAQDAILEARLKALTDLDDPDKQMKRRLDNLNNRGKPLPNESPEEQAARLAKLGGAAPAAKLSVPSGAELDDVDALIASVTDEVALEQGKAPSTFIAAGSSTVADDDDDDADDLLAVYGNVQALGQDLLKGSGGAHKKSTTDALSKEAQDLMKSAAAELKAAGIEPEEPPDPPSGSGGGGLLSALGLGKKKKQQQQGSTVADKGAQNKDKGMVKGMADLGLSDEEAAAIAGADDDTNDDAAVAAILRAAQNDEDF